jgi:hypothetical protein
MVEYITGYRPDSDKINKNSLKSYEVKKAKLDKMEI